MEILENSSLPNRILPPEACSKLMGPPLAELFLLDERGEPGSAAGNMALDEVLLKQARVPVLRVYRWAEPAVSFGYFLPWQAAEAVSAGRKTIRRWTGGGIVEHGEDFTWSLIVPAGEAFSRTRPVESYLTLHGRLAEALQNAGLSVEQVPATTAVPGGGLCFTAPAPGDLTSQGRKIAGAGQRRCREGLLHQGSVSGVRLPHNFPLLLAAALAEKVQDFPPSMVPVAAAEELVRSRYGTDSWQRRRGLP